MKNLFITNRVSLSVLNQEAVAAAATLTSVAFDTLNFRNAILAIDIVATNEVAYSISLTQCETLAGDYTAVPAAKFAAITGTETDDTATEVFEVAVSGLQRYVKAVIVTSKAGTSTIAVVCALGDQNYTPTATEFLEK